MVTEAVVFNDPVSLTTIHNRMVTAGLKFAGPPTAPRVILAPWMGALAGFQFDPANAEIDLRRMGDLIKAVRARGGSAIPGVQALAGRFNSSADWFDGAIWQGIANALAERILPLLDGTRRIVLDFEAKPLDYPFESRQGDIPPGGDWQVNDDAWRLAEAMAPLWSCLRAHDIKAIVLPHVLATAPSLLTRMFLGPGAIIASERTYAFTGLGDAGDVIGVKRLAQEIGVWRRVWPSDWNARYMPALIGLSLARPVVLGQLDSFGVKRVVLWLDDEGQALFGTPDWPVVPGGIKVVNA